ncbi:hypothetical protein QBC34DRAFT_452934 [Podospora aff. communis PSN243]|uniref:Amine oxidase domain-containing protein n=1 Tax=Podospora aff. communis PSN243 TaxID=3040156 RepID=A0AAV9G330_9PEZI|nr:hypothetical protein QBC34DRAFT_452934 [Podospora aff. communis PSN243]
MHNVGNRDAEPRLRTAIIGTGLTGLTTAYLLHNDEQRRYDVTLLEQADSLSFDSASVAVKNHQTGTVERVDLPMRASAGGYYANLNRMYRHLGIPTHPVRFLFVFAKSLRPTTDATTPQPHSKEYFVHASNHHQLLPPRPSGYGLLRYIFEVVYLIVCHFWFTAACFFIPPHIETESVADYLGRIWLPRRYVSHYILPLMSSVSTCTHAQMLAFPAGDLVAYIKNSYRQQHYTVCGGVRQVQTRLAKGIKRENMRVRCRVLSVTPDQQTGQVAVRWQSAGAGDSAAVCEDVFDRVVLAVSPDVVGRILRVPRLSAALEKIPTAWVESSVLAPADLSMRYSIVEHEEEGAVCMHHANSETEPAQVITLRSQFSRSRGNVNGRSEALHAMPGGVVVSTCPLDGVEGDVKRVLKTAGFTRTLRSVESRGVVEAIMGRGEADLGWVNGQDNVWLAGAWCWDGMVLLEGCVVSAMRIAQDFGGILAGVLFSLAALVAAIIAFSLASSDRYNLDHWKLNARVPPVGSLRSPSGEPIRHFDEACAALLREILSTAGLVASDHRSIAVLDLGFGCGDQTWELSRLLKLGGYESLSYVGLTLNESQLQAALRRQDRESANTDSPSVLLFGADAAKPTFWPEEVQDAVHTLADGGFSERWLLALDCLYHFSPSRDAVLHHAARELEANVMAFDLILNKSAPLHQRIVARAVGVLMGCPWRAFLPEEDYAKSLAACGYDPESVIIRDVSDDVFPGLVNYLEKQDAALASYGISLGGGFRLARKVFAWFGRTSVVKGVVVVAQVQPHHKSPL